MTDTSNIADSLTGPNRRVPPRHVRDHIERLARRDDSDLLMLLHDDAAARAEADEAQAAEFDRIGHPRDAAIFRGCAADRWAEVNYINAIFSGEARLS